MARDSSLEPDASTEPVEVVDEYPLKISPWGIMAETKTLYVRCIWRGYNATKNVEKAPATTLSHVIRTLDRWTAIIRLMVAASAEDHIVIECEVRPKVLVKMSERGTMAMRDRRYIGKSA